MPGRGALGGSFLPLILTFSLRAKGPTSARTAASRGAGQLQPVRAADEEGVGVLGDKRYLDVAGLRERAAA